MRAERSGEYTLPCFSGCCALDERALYQFLELNYRQAKSSLYGLAFFSRLLPSSNTHQSECRRTNKIPYLSEMLLHECLITDRFKPLALDVSNTKRILQLAQQISISARQAEGPSGPYVCT